MGAICSSENKKVDPEQIVKSHNIDKALETEKRQRLLKLILLGLIIIV